MKVIHDPFNSMVRLKVSCICAEQQIQAVPGVLFSPGPDHKKKTNIKIKRAKQLFSKMTDESHNFTNLSLPARVTVYGKKVKQRKIDLSPRRHF